MFVVANSKKRYLCYNTHIMNTTIRLLLIIALICGCSLAQPGQPPDVAMVEKTAQAQTAGSLNDALRTLNNDPALKHAHWGFYAQYVEGGAGENVGAFNEEKSLTPASCLKVITTSTALAVLGSNFTFKTQLAYDGGLDAKGTLNGNIWIVGGGDPTLAGAHNRKGLAKAYQQVLNEWVAAIKSAGISKITGAVIGDGRFFEEQGTSPQWLWEDLGNYYGAGACGLNFHENRYDILFKTTSKAGGSTSITGTRPPMPKLEFVNRVRVGGTGDNAYVFGAPYDNLRIVRGTLPANKTGFTVSASVPDAALFAAYNLTDALKKSGIGVELPASSARQLSASARNGKRSVFHTKTSPPLSEIVFWTNKRSINLYAECLLRMLGKHQYGTGDWESGVKAVESFWRERGVNLEGFSMKDGSGLSPTNAVTPKQLTQILRKALVDSSSEAFYESLSLAGDPNDEGFLRGFLDGTSAAKKVRAKSGYIGGARSYAGYAVTKSEKLVAFSIICNRYTCSNTQMKQKMEKIVALLTQLP